MQLQLNGKSPLRRILSLNASERSLSAGVYASGRKFGEMAVSIAWAHQPISQCRLDEIHGYCLWIGHAAFDVSAAEAKQIRETFEPLGLRVEKADPAPVAPYVINSTVDKNAEPRVVPT
jgi:hypothetical protein